MKVHELIYKLNHFHQESDVLVEEPYDSGVLLNTADVEEEPNGDVIIIIT